jgi:hypothetical protein
MKSTFLARFRKQTSVVHFMAVLFVPQFCGFPTTHINAEVGQFFQDHACNGEWHEALLEFNDYRTKTGNFALESVWRFAGEPRLFWSTASTFAPRLARLAGRVLTLTANSVVSERSFSLLNRVHTPSRSRLQAHRVDKIAFIKANRAKVGEVQPQVQRRAFPQDVEEFRREFSELAAAYKGIEESVVQAELEEEEELVMEEVAGEDAVDIEVVEGEAGPQGDLDGSVDSS